MSQVCHIGSGDSLNEHRIGAFAEVPGLLVKWAALDDHYLVVGLWELVDDVEGFALTLRTVAPGQVSPQPLVDDEGRHYELFADGKKGFDILKFALHEGGQSARDLALFRNGFVSKDGLPLLSGDVVATNLVWPQKSFLDTGQNR